MSIPTNSSMSYFSLGRYSDSPPQETPVPSSDQNVLPTLDFESPESPAFSELSESSDPSYRKPFSNLVDIDGPTPKKISEAEFLPLKEFNLVSNLSADFQDIDNLTEEKYKFFPGGKDFLERLSEALADTTQNSSTYAWAAKAFDTDHYGILARNCATRGSLRAVGLELSLKHLMINRRYLMIIKDRFASYFNPEVIFIRAESPQGNEIDLSLQAFDFSTGCYVDLSGENISGIEGSLEDKDLVVQFNKVQEVPPVVYSGRISPDPVKDPGMFYHEEQSEYYCGMHAMNAFIGRRAINAISFQNFCRRNYQQSGLMPNLSRMEPKHFEREGENEFDFRLLDPSWGIDLNVLMAYVKKLSSEHKIRDSFKNLKMRDVVYKEENGKVKLYYRKKSKTALPEVKMTKVTAAFFKNKDRVFIAQTKPDHCVALRRLSDGKSWCVLDSMYESQTLVNPLEYLQNCFENISKPEEIMLKIAFVKGRMRSDIDK